MEGERMKGIVDIDGFCIQNVATDEITLNIVPGAL